MVRRVTPKVPEAAVLRAVLKALAYHPAVAFAHRINTGMFATGEDGKRCVRSAPKGHPDIVGMLRGGRALYIECKSSTGRTTLLQDDFLQRVREHGGVAIVARSVEDVMAALPWRTT